MIAEQYTPAAGACDDYSKFVFGEILKIVDQGVRMSLGNMGRDVYLIENGARFGARILPMTKSGRRGVRARKMFVDVTLNGADLFEVDIWYMDRGAPVLHAAAREIYAHELNYVLLAADYDGDDQVLNPRYFTA